LRPIQLDGAGSEQTHAIAALLRRSRHRTPSTARTPLPAKTSEDGSGMELIVALKPVKSLR
jgi:hypothetical protein